MSGHNRAVFSPRAEEDLRQLLESTYLKWGSKQRDRYRLIIKNGIDDLVRYPMSGRTRPEHGDDVRSRLIGVNIVFYAPSDQGIWILRIVHERRDQDVIGT